mgnify:CR=1 FL=1
MARLPVLAPAGWPVTALLAAAVLAGGPGATGSGAREIVLRDPRLGSPRTRYYEVYRPANPHDYPRSLRTDPRYRQDYPWQIWGLVWEKPGDPPTRRLFVHYQRPEHEGLARRVAATLATIYWIAREYLGVAPRAEPRSRRDPDPQVHLWLRADGEAGGEEFLGHLYLHAADQPRAAAEWIREIAHEYAHAVLPSIGPYSEPERWANGYLGERLFLKWLIDSGQSGVWGESFPEAGYLAAQIAPLRNRFLEEGPFDPALFRGDAAGMERLIGFVLAIEATHELAVLRRVFAQLSSPSRPAAVRDAVEDVLASPIAPGFRIEGGAQIPSRSRGRMTEGGWQFTQATYWIFLPAGEWEIVADGDPPAAMELIHVGHRLRLTRMPADGRFRVAVRAATWRQLEVTAPPERPVLLRGLDVRRVPGSEAAGVPQERG